MKFIGSWLELHEFGIELLTGEACGLMYRILFDVTENGANIIRKCFDIDIKFSEPWNRGSDEDRHVGSIMLSNEMLTPLAIFALLESGFNECWLCESGVVGFEATDNPQSVDAWKKRYKCTRRFSYGGTAGSRNRHEFSGRVT